MVVPRGAGRFPGLFISPVHTPRALLVSYGRQRYSLFCHGDIYPTCGHVGALPRGGVAERGESMILIE